MAKILECPPSPVLVELVQGKLADPDLTELSLHLEQCAACQEKARTGGPNDTLVESLRGPAPVEDQLAQNVPRELLERLKQIPERDAAGEPDLADDFEDTAPDERELAVLAPPQGADALGRLGPYRILKVLGRGGMGVVFLAEDTRLVRRVALKMMLPRIAANPRARQRFLCEARAAAGLKNDHIVTIYEVEEANGVPYLAMELLEGQSLQELLHAGRALSASEIVHLARDIAQGLAAAHDKGLVHRDIKPGNLWVERAHAGVRVKILDFGLARAETQEANFTHAGAVVGTPEYMAPEQARGNGPIDSRADLFSLGCVLYRLCAGELPFKAATTMGTLMAIVLDDPAGLAGRSETIPPELARLIMDLLAKDPSRRPQSATEVLARLAEIERSLPSTPADSAASPPPSPATAGQPPDNYVPLAFALGGLVFAAGIVLAAIFFWQTPDGRVVRIESDDPAIQIAFAGGELKVTGAYKEPITLQPGKVALKIVRPGANGDDFTFETDKLLVNQGDKIVLKIELMAGQIQLVQAGKGVLDSKALTPADDGDAWQESVAGMEARDQAAAVAMRLKKLHPTFDERSFFPRIEKGVVVAVEIGDASALKDLTPLRALAGLKELYLDGRFVGAADLRPLRGLKLVSFASNGCPHRDLSPLAGMPLTKANFWGCATTDLSPLEGMKLVETNLGHSRIQNISVLKGMPLELVCLNLSLVEDLTPLAGAPLKRLFAAHTKVKDLKPIANAPIEWLCIDGSPIEDLTPLLSMPLKQLELDNPRQHAELLRKIPTLRTINFKPVAEALGDVAATADVDRRAAEWVLSLGGGVRINGQDHEIKAKTELPKQFTLTGINLNGKHVTDAGLANLRDLQGLTLLYLDGTPVTDAGLAHLKDLAGLRHLSLYGDQVTNTGLAHFQNCKGLLRLELGCTLATDAGLAHFKDCQGLTFLGLSSLELTNKGLVPLQGFAELGELNLQKTPVSDAGLAHLKDLKRLKLLTLLETKVTEAGMAEFHTSLPHCKIVHDRGSIEAKD